jgi:UDP-N-acetylglucosamine:LPS N-acetylglucosamine transferase
MIPQGDLKPERLAARLESLWRSPEMLAAAAAQARAAGQPDATAKLAELVCAMLDANHAGGAGERVRKAA